MTTKHTPGPWTVHINYASANYTVFDADGNYGELDAGTLEANARLIAAAPDLLAALIELQQWAGYNGIPEGTGEIALAAISKATQGQ